MIAGDRVLWFLEAILSFHRYSSSHLSPPFISNSLFNSFKTSFKTSFTFSFLTSNFTSVAFFPSHFLSNFLFLPIAHLPSHPTSQHISHRISHLLSRLTSYSIYLPLPSHFSPFPSFFYNVFRLPTTSPPTPPRAGQTR